MKSTFGTPLTVVTVSIPTEGGMSLKDQVARFQRDLTVRFPDRYGLNVLGSPRTITAYVSVPTHKIGA